MWKAAVKADPSFPTAWRNLGMALWNVRRDGDAAQSWNDVMPDVVDTSEGGNVNLEPENIPVPDTIYNPGEPAAPPPAPVEPAAPEPPPAVAPVEEPPAAPEPVNVPDDIELNP